MNIAFGIATSKEHETMKTFAADVDSLPLKAADLEARSHLKRVSLPGAATAAHCKWDICRRSPPGIATTKEYEAVKNIRLLFRNAVTIL
jgi:hypothetical protein